MLRQGAGEGLIAGTGTARLVGGDAVGVFQLAGGRLGGVHLRRQRLEALLCALELGLGQPDIGPQLRQLEGIALGLLEGLQLASEGGRGGAQA
ncbi:hypothetical protein D3C84_1083170 [compost metagenome]